MQRMQACHYQGQEQPNLEKSLATATSTVEPSVTVAVAARTAATATPLSIIIPTVTRSGGISKVGGFKPVAETTKVVITCNKRSPRRPPDDGVGATQ